MTYGDLMKSSNLLDYALWDQDRITVERIAFEEWKEKHSFIEVDGNSGTKEKEEK